MFANRFTAFVDACVLAGMLKRNLLLSLAEAEFYRVRWSDRVLDETEAAIKQMRCQRGFIETSSEDARRARRAIERKFEESRVTDFDGIVAIPDFPTKS